MKNICIQMSRKAWLALTLVLCLSFPALAQKITVKGTVIDELGEPMIGASVIVKGTGIGTSTDIDGNYQLEGVASDAIIVFSYIGYTPKEEPVNGRTKIDVTMDPSSTMLQDVVVIGYGSVKKSDATGSVATIKPDEIEAGIATSAQDLLVGASPGVVVTPGGGSPEGGATIRIRGGASLNASNDPLIVLDGVPLSNDGVDGMANPFAMIAPDNIESMTILKDASATAIYGSRASNGVIIITTKKGRSGAPQVNFSANMTVQHDRKRWDVLSADEFRDVIGQYWGKESAAYAALGQNNTDWQKQVLRTSVSQEYNLSVGGSAGFLPYRASVSYTDNKGIIKNTEMQRLTAGFNLTPRFFDGLLQVNANVKGYYIKNRFSNDGAVGIAMGSDPTRAVFSNIASGNSEFPYFYNGYNIDMNGRDINIQAPNNPVAEVSDQDNTASIWRSNGNLQIDYALHFLPELRLNLNLGYDVTKSTNNIYLQQNSPTAWRSNYQDGAGAHTYRYELRRNTLLDFYANYKKNFEAIESDLDVMVGYSWQRFHAHGNNVTRMSSAGFFMPSATDNVLTINPATSDRIGKETAPWYYWDNGNLQLLSFFGRLNYTYKDTYLLTFTLRDDGTSRFAKNNRWGLFPSVALGWKINNMPFMESIREDMNEFKLRLGYGITGQQSVGGYFDYMPIYSQSQQGSYYPNLYTGQYGTLISPQGLTYYPQGYNPNLKWEETTTWNVGVDMGWFDNRFTLAFDWYLRNSKDLLANVTVAPGAATTNEMVQNVGTLRNVGIEATIGARIFQSEDFTWTSSYNIGWNKNEITKLNATNDPNYYVPLGGMGATGNTCQAHKVGYPAYTFLLYEQIYDESGNPIEGAYVDQNGDGVINSSDLVFKHSKDPKVTMSWNNSFNYKNWDFSFQLRASIGNYVYNNILAGQSYLNGTYTNSFLHNMVKTDNYFKGQQFFSDYFLENAGFVRCDNITFGYTFPNLLNNKLRLRLYGAVQNPFVITKYKGIDPEIFDGIDRSTYPRPVSYTVGLIANF
ncbi:MAG: TonB-dependent receptor [Muribaculaceae bacterium]|nr:TonB-dependent receptor [Muribaculaceae bacterium]